MNIFPSTGVDPTARVYRYLLSKSDRPANKQHSVFRSLRCVANSAKCCVQTRFSALTGRISLGQTVTRIRSIFLPCIRRTPATDNVSHTSLHSSMSSLKTSGNRVIDVGMGEVRCVADSSSVLHTRDLSFCSALAVLSEWNGEVYGKRTLMHLKGGSLTSGINNGQDPAREWLTRFQADLAGGGKVILVGGVHAESDLSLNITLNQMDEKRSPALKALFNMPSIDVEIAGSHGITVFPNGRFALEEGSGRGVLSKQECAAILQDGL